MGVVYIRVTFIVSHEERETKLVLFFNTFFEHSFHSFLGF